MYPEAGTTHVYGQKGLYSSFKLISLNLENFRDFAQCEQHKPRDVYAAAEESNLFLQSGEACHGSQLCDNCKGVPQCCSAIRDHVCEGGVCPPQVVRVAEGNIGWAIAFIIANFYFFYGIALVTDEFLCHAMECAIKRNQITDIVASVREPHKNIFEHDQSRILTKCRSKSCPIIRIFNLFFINLK